MDTTVVDMVGMEEIWRCTSGVTDIIADLVAECSQRVDQDTEGTGWERDIVAVD